MPEISVLTAAWLDTTKKVEWLAEAGESVVGQEGVDLEWVVIDDHSPLEPDGLPQDPRIRVERASHRQGPARCRNTAASLAQADALIVLDADDVLAAPDVLLRLMEAWRKRPDRFYYGDIQLYNNGVPGKVIKFPVYNFLQTLDPKGLVPVTALVSREAWYKAGGWKPALERGLEDVEFWISAGKAGFCGYKLDMTTILYRRHPESRTALMRREGGRGEREMRQMIREMHADLYRGELPMGCCGGKRGGGNVGRPLPLRQPAPRMTAMDDLPGGKVWVRYTGERGAAFYIRGQVTGAQYEVQGRDAEFQIHAQDAHYFRSLGRGRDFAVGVAPPKVEAPEPEPEERRAEEYQPPPPEPAEIVGTVPEAEEESPAPVLADLPTPEEIAEVQKEHPLEGLSVNANVKAMMEAEGWTIPGLARAEPGELTPYPGVGLVTAEKMIAEAKRLWAG